MDLSTYRIDGYSYNGFVGNVVEVACTACDGLTVGRWDTSEDDDPATLQALVDAATAHHTDTHQEF